MVKKIAMVFCCLSFFACKIRQQQNAETKAIVLGKDKIIMDYLHPNLVVAKQCSVQQLEQYKAEVQKLIDQAKTNRHGDINLGAAREVLLAQSCPEGEEIFFEFNKFVELLQIKINGRPLPYLSKDVARTHITLDKIIGQIQEDKDSADLLADLRKTADTLKKLENSYPINDTLIKQLENEVYKLNSELVNYNENIYEKIWALTFPDQSAYIVPEDSKLYGILLSIFKDNYDDKGKYQQIYNAPGKILPSFLLTSPLPQPTQIQRRKDVQPDSAQTTEITLNLSHGITAHIELAPRDYFILLNDSLHEVGFYSSKIPYLFKYFIGNGTIGDYRFDFNKERQNILQQLKNFDVSIVQYNLTEEQFYPLWFQKVDIDEFMIGFDKINSKEYIAFGWEDYVITVMNIYTGDEFGLAATDVASEEDKTFEVLQALAQKLPPNRLVNIKGSIGRRTLPLRDIGLLNYFKNKVRYNKTQQEAER